MFDRDDFSVPSAAHLNNVVFSEESDGVRIR